MEIKIYTYFAIITFLNLNVNARNIMKTSSYFHSKNDMHDKYLAREEFLQGSQAALTQPDKCTEDKNCEYGEKCDESDGQCKCPENVGGQNCDEVDEESCMAFIKNCRPSDGNCKYLQNRTMICDCDSKYFHPLTKICTDKCTEDRNCEYGEKCDESDGHCKCPENVGGENCDEVDEESCLAWFQNCKSSDGNCKYLQNRTMICDCDSKYFHPLTKICTDGCTSNPCENGGSCAVVHGITTCFCKDSFTGNYCERDRCIPNPCENGGICALLNGNRTCFCKDSFTGNYCEKGASEWDKLSSSVIFTTPQNSSSVSNYETTMSQDFNSTFTKTLLTPTASRREENISFTSWGNGTTTGASTVIPDLCSLRHCTNGGICRVVKHKPRCLCHSPFTGEFCEKDPCTENPCQNDGTCLLFGYTFKCICKGNFTGDKCETRAVKATFTFLLVIASLLIVTFILYMSCFVFRSKCTSKS